MATSRLGHYVRFGESTIDALDPFDSETSGDILGNLNHLADQYAQVRIAWALPTGGTSYAVAAGVAEVDGYQRLWTSTPFDMHVRASGESYKCRLRVRVAANITGVGSAPASFRFALSAPGEADDELNSAGNNRAVESVSTAGVAEWRTHSALIWLDAPRVVRATQAVAAIDAVSGETRSARWLRVTLTAWAHVDSIADDTAQLTGLELAEYLAP